MSASSIRELPLAFVRPSASCVRTTSPAYQARSASSSPPWEPRRASLILTLSRGPSPRPRRTCCRVSATPKPRTLCSSAHTSTSLCVHRPAVFLRCAGIARKGTPPTTRTPRLCCAPRVAHRPVCLRAQLKDYSEHHAVTHHFPDAYVGQNTKIRDTLNNLILKQVERIKLPSLAIRARAPMLMLLPAARAGHPSRGRRASDFPTSRSPGPWWSGTRFASTSASCSACRVCSRAPTPNIAASDSRPAAHPPALWCADEGTSRMQTSLRRRQRDRVVRRGLAMMIESDFYATDAGRQCAFPPQTPHPATLIVTGMLSCSQALCRSAQVHPLLRPGGVYHQKPSA